MADAEVLGDKLFNEFAYTDAVEAYQRAHAKNTSSNTLILKIAESYRRLNDPKNALAWYEKVLNDKPDVAPEYYLHYAEALSSEKKYAEAKSWYDTYGGFSAEDGRVNKKITTINDQEELFRNVSFVTTNKADFNQEGSDFSPAFFGSKLVFVTSRPDDTSIPVKFLWDDSHYLELYQVDENGNVSAFDKKINSKYHEGPLVFYENDNKVIFTRNNYHKGKITTDREGITKLKLYSAEYNAEENTWNNILPLDFNNDHYSVGHPAISSDGNFLYFSSDMPGGYGGTDLYRVYNKDNNWWRTWDQLSIPKGMSSFLSYIMIVIYTSPVTDMAG
ncbi:PD40 domain-containing protein [Fulvivirga sp. M361]|uniref:tetratricopeptide repeat protein n=1 Tax=Fulvivirga sp. M361 TaxID=2594266 RepID=UPI00162A48BB|nr:PD40 domain-containing protein [Fulvivirga sp. M361]